MPNSGLRLALTLELDPEAVSDPIDVGVVADELGEVQDVRVRQPVLAQRIDVRARDGARRRGQLERVRKQRDTARVEASRAPVGLDALEQRIVLQQPAQTAPVMRPSVVASVVVGHDERDELAVHLAQRLRSAHDGRVQREVRAQPGRVQRVDPEDVIQLPCLRVDGLREQLRQLALGLREALRIDPCHAVRLLAGRRGPCPNPASAREPSSYPAPMPLDPEICYRAFESRDARFDGRFFTAVRTTGIYCRPVCPAPTPRRANVEFVPSAAAAEARGYRACLRCRPDAAPGSPEWLGSSAQLERALRRIRDGALEADGVPALAASVGLSARHLTRLFHEELGATPLEVARTQRAHAARRLIEDTSLPMTDVAFAAGYGSLRSFNAEVRARFGFTPSELRGKRRGAGVATDAPLALRLAYRGALDWESTLRYLAARAIPGVEVVADGRYRRSVQLGEARGWIEVAPEPKGDQLLLTARIDGLRALPSLVERVRGLFDLRADPDGIAEDLAADPALQPLVERLGAPRLLAGWDAFEVAVRAVLGQQVSVAAARTQLGRLVALCDDSPATEEAPGASRTSGASTKNDPSAEPVTLTSRDDRFDTTRLFPTAQQIAAADLDAMPLPRSRRATLRGLAEAVARGDLDLSPGVDPVTTRTALLALPGIGPWTADYVALRGLRDPDAFPAGDLGLRKALARGADPLNARDLERRAEAWRPWRAYAAMLLWRSLSEKPHDDQLSGTRNPDRTPLAARR